MYSHVTPKADREDIAPEKQTIHNALMKKPEQIKPTQPLHLAQHNRESQSDMRHPNKTHKTIYFVEEEYFVTALVPSETACLASSPGRISLTLYVR